MVFEFLPQKPSQPSNQPTNAMSFPSIPPFSNRLSIILSIPPKISPFQSGEGRGGLLLVYGFYWTPPQSLDRIFQSCKNPKKESLGFSYHFGHAEESRTNLGMLKEHLNNRLITVWFFISFWSSWSSYCDGGWPFLIGFHRGGPFITMPPSPSRFPSPTRFPLSPKYWLFMQQSDYTEKRGRWWLQSIVAKCISVENTRGRQMQLIAWIYFIMWGIFRRNFLGLSKAFWNSLRIFLSFMFLEDS